MSGDKLCETFARVLKLDACECEKDVCNFLMRYFEGEVDVEDVEKHGNVDVKRERLVKYLVRYTDLSEREIKMVIGRAFGKWKKKKQKCQVRKLQDVAILAIGGYPGSGKSKLARALCHVLNASNLKAHWVNQDECGSSKMYHKKIRDVCKAGTRILILDKIHTIKVHFEKSIHAVRDSGADVSELVFLRIFHEDGLDKTFKTCLERIQSRGSAHRTLTASNDSEVEAAREILTRLISGRQPFREIALQLNKILKSPIQKIDLNISLDPIELLSLAVKVLRASFKPCHDLDVVVSESLLKKALESSFNFERTLTSSSSSKITNGHKKSSPIRGGKDSSVNKLSSRYVALFLSDETRSRLLKRFPARFSTVLADHITLNFNPSREFLESLTLGSVWSVRFSSRGAQHDEGVQAILVDFIQNGTTVVRHQFPEEKGKVLHVTMSTAVGCNASEAASMLRCQNEKKKKDDDDDESFEIQARLGCEMKLGSRYFWRCFDSKEMGKLLGLKSWSTVVGGDDDKWPRATGTRRKGDGVLETPPSDMLIRNLISAREYAASCEQKDAVLHLDPVSDFERHLIHGFAESLGLSHESQGLDEKRHIALRKKKIS